MTAQRKREKTTDILKRASQTRAVIVVEHDMEFVAQARLQRSRLLTRGHSGRRQVHGTTVTSNRESDPIVYSGRGHTLKSRIWTCTMAKAASLRSVVFLGPPRADHENA